MLRAALFMISVSCLGQPDTLYLNKEEQITYIADSVFYKRVLLGVNRNGSSHVVDYMANGSKYFEGSVEFLNSRFYSGKYTHFYSNGKKESEGIEKKGGDQSVTTYYRTGALMCEVKVKSSRFYNLVRVHDRNFVLAANDSLGNPTLVNGSGIASCQLGNPGFVWKGSVKDFLMDGAWSVFDLKTGNIVKIEYYDNGQWIRGVNLIDGSQIEYYEQVEFTGFDRNKFTGSLKELVTKQAQAIPGAKKTYHFGLVFRNGKAVSAIQLLQTKGEKVFDLRDAYIPKAVLKIDGQAPKYYVTGSFKISL